MHYLFLIYFSDIKSLSNQYFSVTVFQGWINTTVPKLECLKEKRHRRQNQRLRLGLT